MFSENTYKTLKAMMPSYPDVDLSPFKKKIKKKEYKKKDYFIRDYSEEDKIALVESGIMRIYLLNNKG